MRSTGMCSPQTHLLAQTEGLPVFPCTAENSMCTLRNLVTRHLPSNTECSSNSLCDLQRTAHATLRNRDELEMTDLLCLLAAKHRGHTSWCSSLLRRKRNWKLLRRRLLVPSVPSQIPEHPWKHHLCRTTHCSDRACFKVEAENAPKSGYGKTMVGLMVGLRDLKVFSSPNDPVTTRGSISPVQTTPVCAPAHTPEPAALPAFTTRLCR